MANFPTHNDRIARAYAIAAEETHKAGLMIFGHAENAPAALRDGLDVVEHVWGYTQAAMSPAELRDFQQGKHLTWATFVSDWGRQDEMIRDTIARGGYLNPTLHYEWGGMSARAKERELEDYTLLSRPELVYFPKNIMGSLLYKHRQIKNFSSRYENMVWIDRLPAEDRKQFEAGYKNVLEFTKRFVQAGGKIQAGTDTITGGVPGASLHHEMEMLVEAGLTPMQALKAATSWSSELLAGKNGARGNPRVGSIRPGNYRRFRGCRRQSAGQHLQHQANRARDEGRTLGRARLSSGILFVHNARAFDRGLGLCTRDQRDHADRLSKRAHVRRVLRSKAAASRPRRSSRSTGSRSRPSSAIPSASSSICLRASSNVPRPIRTRRLDRRRMSASWAIARCPCASSIRRPKAACRTRSINSCGPAERNC